MKLTGSEFPFESPEGWSGAAAFTRDGRLLIVDGETSGDETVAVELRVWISNSCEVMCGGFVCDWDEVLLGDSSVWQSLTGEVVLSADHWKSEDVLVLDYAFEGRTRGETRSIERRVFFRVPK